MSAAENLSSTKIAIIGCGNLGTALARCLSPHYQLSLYDKGHAKAHDIATANGCSSSDQLAVVLKDAALVLLVIKPGDLTAAATEIRNHLSPQTIVASALATTSLQELHQQLGDTTPLIRFMPNIACAFGDSAVALAGDPTTTLQQRQLIDQLLTPLGSLFWVEEALMPACVSLIGSTPAFFFVVIEALVDASIAMGFPAPMAQQLVQQVCSGALTTLKETGLHPAVLKWQVASPAGTTIAGLATLEYHGLRNALIQTLLTAHQRARVF